MAYAFPQVSGVGNYLSSSTSNSNALGLSISTRMKKVPREHSDDKKVKSLTKKELSKSWEHDHSFDPKNLLSIISKCDADCVAAIEAFYSYITVSDTTREKDKESLQNQRIAEAIRGNVISILTSVIQYGSQPSETNTTLISGSSNPSMNYNGRVGIGNVGNSNTRFNFTVTVGGVGKDNNSTSLSESTLYDPEVKKKILSLLSLFLETQEGKSNLLSLSELNQGSQSSRGSSLSSSVSLPSTPRYSNLLPLQKIILLISEKEHPSVRLLTANILSSLSKQKEFCKAIERLGGVKTLARTLSHSFQDLQSIILIILSQCVTHSHKTSLEIKKSSSLPQILALMLNGGVPDEQTITPSPSTPTTPANPTEITIDRPARIQDRGKIYTPPTGGLSSSLSNLNILPFTIQYYATLVIAKCLEEITCRNEIRKLSGLSFMVKVLLDQISSGKHLWIATKAVNTSNLPSNSLIKAIIQALAVFCSRDQKCSVELVNLGITSHLLTILSSSNVSLSSTPDSELQSNSCIIISKICLNEECREKVRESGLLQNIITLLQSCTDTLFPAQPQVGLPSTPNLPMHNIHGLQHLNYLQPQTPSSEQSHPLHLPPTIQPQSRVRSNTINPSSLNFLPTPSTPPVYSLSIIQNALGLLAKVLEALSQALFSVVASRDFLKLGGMDSLINLLNQFSALYINPPSSPDQYNNTLSNALNSPLQNVVPLTNPSLPILVPSNLPAKPNSPIFNVNNANNLYLISQNSEDLLGKILLTVANCCQWVKNKSEIRKLGGTVSLVNLLNHDSTSTISSLLRCATVKAISNLVYDYGNRRLMGNIVLNNNTENEHPGEKTERSERERGEKSERFQRSERLLDNNNSNNNSNLSYSVYNLEVSESVSSSGFTKRTILSVASGLTRLIEIADKLIHLSTVQELPTIDLNTLIYSLQAISGCANEPDTRIEIGKGQGLKVLMQCLNHSSLEVKYNALCTLNVCALNPDNALEICDIGGLAKTIALRHASVKNITFFPFPSIANQALSTLLSNNLHAKYWFTGLILPNQIIQDGFYEFGHSPCYHSLSDLLSLPVDPLVEVILINTNQDENLASYISHANQLMSGISQPATVRSKVEVLAQYVSELMGGICEYDDYDCFSYDKPLKAIKTKLSSNVVPIGLYRKGVARHRALLFKVLGDRVGVFSSLVRSKYLGRSYSWNNIVMDGTEYVVDLLHKVGSLYADQTTQNIAYKRTNKQ